MPVELLYVSLTLIEKKLNMSLRDKSYLIGFFFLCLLFFFKSSYMRQGLMSKRAELNISVWFFLERACYWSYSGPGPNAVWIRGCCISDRGESDTCELAICLHRGGEKTALQNTHGRQNTHGSVSKPHSHMVSPLCKGKESVDHLQESQCRAVLAALVVVSEHHWLSASVPHGACRRFPAQCAARCPASEYVRFSAENHILYLWIQSVSEAFSYFHIFVWKLYSKGLKCPLCYLFFFNISQEQKSVSYPAAIVTEVREQSASSWEKNRIVHMLS